MCKDKSNESRLNFTAMFLFLAVVVMAIKTTALAADDPLLKKQTAAAERAAEIEPTYVKGEIIVKQKILYRCVCSRQSGLEYRVRLSPTFRLSVFSLCPVLFRGYNHSYA